MDVSSLAGVSWNQIVSGILPILQNKSVQDRHRGDIVHQGHSGVATKHLVLTFIQVLTY